MSTLDVPGARLHYEVRGAGPLVLLAGAPMDARPFAPLADLLATDHTVVTTDPRGINRSPVDDPSQDSTPEMRADDLARLLIHVDAGPAVVLGSSGGAVTALALVQARPDLVDTAVAHEPPVIEMLGDRDKRHAATEEMIATYLAGDVLGAWEQFLTAADIHMPREMIEGVFLADRSPQAVADEHFQYAHMLRPTTRFRPDVAALRAAPTRVLIGIGEASTGQLCDLTSTALAEALGIAPTMFPGDHVGFAGEPEAFAARLREVLGDSRG
jgi:pimeloyl-ACP methyl ester carboxylesterase